MQCRGIGPHLTARGKSYGFSRVAVGSWGIFSSYGGDGPSKLMFVQRHQDSCLVMSDTSGISTKLGSTIWTLLNVRWETQCPFPVCTWILGFLLIFKKSQASSAFETLNSECHSTLQRDVRPPVQRSCGLQAFSRFFKRYSDIPSSCQVKDKPACKPLQGNLALLRVRACRVHST